MLRALLLGAALLVLSSPSEACSPADYGSKYTHLQEAQNYVDEADWIAIGQVVSFEEVSIAEVWQRYKNYPNEDILAGLRRSKYLYFRLHELKAVRYTFEMGETIKGPAPRIATVWSVDYADSEHPKKVIGKWDERMAFGSHPNDSSCTIFPAFEVGQSAMLFKRRKLTGADFPNEPNLERRKEFAWMFSRPAFRDLEPTEGNEEWVNAIRSRAKPAASPEATP